MIKYHVNPKTGRPNVCNAKTRTCPIGGEHFLNKNDARRSFEKTQSPAIPKASKKIDDWERWKMMPQETKDKWYDREISDVSYDYDNYGQGWDCNCPEWDQHRCQEYDGLRVDEVNFDGVLVDLGDLKSKDEITDDLRELGKTLNLDTPDVYEATTRNGYYGAEPYVTIYDYIKVALAFEDWKTAHQK